MTSATNPKRQVRSGAAIVDDIPVNCRLADDLLWGVDSIADEIGRTPRQVYYLLEGGQLPAQKIGGRWCASRARLRKFFEGSAVESAPTA